MPDENKVDSRPPPPSWLNQEFMQTALRTGDSDPTITVVSCDYSMANAAGDGYLSNMYRAVAKQQDGRERRLVIKCQPQGGLQGEFVQKIEAYEKETKMFSETLPAMQKVLKAVGIHQPLSAKCLYHGTNPVPFIVLEDLRESGFTLADRLQGLDMDHCKLVLKSHALFHASSLYLYEQDPTVFDCYKQPMFSEAIREEMEPFLHSSFRGLEESVLKWTGYERFSEKLKTLRQNLFSRIIKDGRYKEGKFNTLLHGDTWTNNLMFKYSEGTVKDVRLLDFQICYYSSPTIDLQTFLAACPNEEVRDYIEVLLKYYYTILVETMQKLKCKTKIVTFEEFKRDFNEHSIFGVFYAFVMLPMVMSESMKTMTMEDLGNPDDMSARILGEVSSGGAYERVMKRLLVEYENIGIL